MTGVLLAVCEHGYPYAAIMLDLDTTVGSLRDWLDELDDDATVVFGQPDLVDCRDCSQEDTT